MCEDMLNVSYYKRWEFLNNRDHRKIMENLTQKKYRDSIESNTLENEHGFPDNVVFDISYISILKPSLNFKMKDIVSALQLEYSDIPIYLLDNCIVKAILNYCLGKILHDDSRQLHYYIESELNKIADEFNYNIVSLTGDISDVDGFNNYVDKALKLTNELISDVSKHESISNRTMLPNNSLLKHNSYIVTPPIIDISDMSIIAKLKVVLL